MWEEKKMPNFKLDFGLNLLLKKYIRKKVLTQFFRSFVFESLFPNHFWRYFWFRINGFIKNGFSLTIRWQSNVMKSNGHFTIDFHYFLSSVRLQSIRLTDREENFVFIFSINWTDANVNVYFSIHWSQLIRSVNWAKRNGNCSIK